MSEKHDWYISYDDGPQDVIRNHEGGLVAMAYGDNAAKTAIRIVHCVNAYDCLKALADHYEQVVKALEVTGSRMEASFKEAARLKIKVNPIDRIWVSGMKQTLAHAKALLEEGESDGK